MSSTFVSVIIPTYNRASVLKRAINSVLNQTYKNIELIIIDDGSTDETQELLDQLNLESIKTTNGGVSKARNLGIQQAQGKWLAFLDSDDEWLPEKLEKQIAFSNANPNINIIHGEEIWIRNGVRVNPKHKHKKGGGDQFLPSLKLCAISPSTVMLKKSIFNEHILFREDFPCCEDYDLWLRLTSVMNVGFIDEFLIKKYGGHEDQLSQKYKAMDYWRVKSIDWIFKNRDLSTERKNAALEELFKKSKVLLKGYEKHDNTGEHYREIKNIMENYFS